MEYTKSFRSSMVRKMSGPRARSATALAKETGIPQPTLSRWLRDAGSVGGVAPEDRNDPPARRPQDWPLEDILTAVLEAARLSGEELGAYLRRQGIHQAHLDAWRAQLAAGLQGGGGKPTGRRSTDARRVQELEKEIRRKDKALAEAAALLLLQKKVREIWGDGDASTPPRSES
jgi:transposase-like protein